MPRGRCYALLLLLTCSALIGAKEQIEEIFSYVPQNPGYYLVTTIPEGATSINVTELSNKKNFLSVRLSNGVYIFNEDFQISSSNKYKGAGTNFIYIRRNINAPETFYAAGPLNSSIDVMLIYQHDKAIVKCQYQLPIDFKMTVPAVPDTAKIKDFDLEASSSNQSLSFSTNADNLMLRDEIRSTIPKPMKRSRSRYVWKLLGFSSCSRTCGKGFQKQLYICIRKSRIHGPEQVPHEKCDPLKKPSTVSIRCNSAPCPPAWIPGPWGACSVTCGNGTRTREVQCVQEKTRKKRVRVEDHLCPKDQLSILSKESCFMPDCNLYRTAKPSFATKRNNAPPRWKAEEWSPCSTTCGMGKRTRIVTCVTYAKACDLKEKPSTEELCNMNDCTTNSLLANDIPEALTDTLWLHSAWPEKCSVECGTGIISRRLYCENFLKNGTCGGTMPVLNITCRTNECGRWFVGPWSECSSSCGFGFQTREVACISRVLKSLKVVSDSYCEAPMPEVQSGCMGPPCNATWFMSDWSKCNKKCGTGIQKREVRCVGPDGNPISDAERECEEIIRPANERICNDVPCNIDSDKVKSALVKTSKENFIENACRDTLPTCSMLRENSKDLKYDCQAKTYKNGCCKTCSQFKRISN